MNYLKKLLTYPLIWLQGERVITVVSGNIGDLWVTESLFKRRVRTSPVGIQTAVNKPSPWKPCYFNYRAVAKVLRKQTKVDRFLMGGVGGGSFLHTFRHWFPKAEIEAVDIDPAMLRLAKVFFNIPEDVNLTVGDFREYLQKNHGVFDFIYIDVFDGMYPPEEFYKKSFLESVKKALSQGGTVCMNTVKKHPWDKKHQELRNTFEEIFDNVKEMYGFEGRILPLLPHNVVLVVNNDKGR